MPNDLVPSAPSPVAALPFSPARTLIEVTQAAEVRPLPPGDGRYLDLTPGHGSMAMAQLRYRLKAMAVAEPQTDGRDCAKIVFTGHRGSGKTTVARLVGELYAAIGLLPLFTMCDRNDIGGVSMAEHPDTGMPTVFVYDGYSGGAGFTWHGYIGE